MGLKRRNKKFERRVDKGLRHNYLVDYLKKDEEILMEIAPNKGFMFHLYDAVLIIFVLFALFISLSMFYAINITSISIDSFSFLPLLFAIAILFIFFRSLYIRYLNSIHTWYYITNQRIIFRRKYGFLENRWFNRIDEFTFEHKGNDKGYIVVGKMKTPFDDILAIQGFGWLFRRKGISFEQSPFIIDNLSKYSRVRDLIQSLRK